MPLLTTATITQPVAYEVTNFSVDAQLGAINITYFAGTMSSDTPPMFIPQGSALYLRIDGTNFTNFLVVNPTLYPVIKAALYSLIEVAQGVTSTSI